MKLDVRGVRSVAQHANTIANWGNAGDAPRALRACAR
jgi:hypothetical protein